MAKQLIETIGQFQDALLKDRKDTVTVSGGSQVAHFGGLIQRCYRHYTAVPKDGALLQAIGDVAEHRGCPPYFVRRMTLEEFNAALDEVFKAAERPVYIGDGRIRAGADGSPTKAPGGRPRKWDALWKMIQAADQETPKPKDQAIANRYNQKFGASIGQGKRKRATAAIVRDVRNRYRKLKRKQKHD